MKRAFPGLVILLSAAAPALAASLVWPVQFVPDNPSLARPAATSAGVYRALLVMP